MYIDAGNNAWRENHASSGRDSLKGVALNTLFRTNDEQGLI